MQIAIDESKGGWGVEVIVIGKVSELGFGSDFVWLGGTNDGGAVIGIYLIEGLAFRSGQGEEKAIGIDGNEVAIDIGEEGERSAIEGNTMVGGRQVGGTVIATWVFNGQ